ncbi:FtsQ-type POTRA domain-containing protein, partial [bacterium]|nr:FtsQ-type POTRA domain-containing protein [bacterium]
RVLLIALGVALTPACVLLGRAGVTWLAEREALAVREVRFVGCAQATEDDLRALAGVAPGDRWLTLDTDGVAFRVESHPWVDRVRVARPRPGRVVVRVRECRPVAVIQVQGRSYGLCEDLRIVPGTGGQEDLPIIRDFDSGAGADPEALSRALEYVRVFREYDLAHGLRLDLHAKGGDVIALPSQGFSARVEGRIAASRAARSVAAFLETLDAEGGGRGTLQVISEKTAVWRASA